MPAAQLTPMDQLPAIAPDERLSLAEGEVDLWCFFYAQPCADPQLCARYDALMTSQERAQQQRLLFDKDRRLFLATRALVRTVLSRYGATAPSDWRFEHNRYGKPFLADGSIHFNLTNTRGLVVCAVSQHHEALGVDAENLERKTETVEIADRFFSASEVRALHALPADRHQQRFFSYWTLKESYIKARGMGLAIPLGDFSFELDDGDDIAIAFAPTLEDEPHRWQFRLLRASPEHFVAVAIGSDSDAPLRLRASRFTPLRDLSAFSS